MVKKIEELSQEQNIGLYEFVQRTENLVKKSKGFVDHPKYDNSIIFQSFNWLRQAQFLGMVMNKIKKFDKTKLDKASYKQFKQVYVAVQSEQFKKVKIKVEDLMNVHMVNFLEYMEEAAEIENKLEKIRM
jgi:hypothetical protein